MTATTQIQSALSRWGIKGTTLAIGVGFVLGAMVLLRYLGDFLIEPDYLTLMLVALFFCGLLALAAGYGRDRVQRSRWIILILWWGLLVSQEVFNYHSDVTSVSASDFAPEAFTEVILWVIVSCGVVVTLLKFPHYLRGMFEGDYKWVTWLTLYSIVSCAYAPSVAFSLAWAFKLALVVLVVHLCSQEMSKVAGIRAFLNTVLWALVLLILLPTVRSIFEPDPLAGSTRGALEFRFLHEAPTEISALSGLLLVLCLTLYSAKRQRFLIAIAAVSFVLMIIAGGKTGIVAGFVSGILFYAMQKRVKAALGFTAVIALGITLALLFTPLGQYAANYMKLDEIASLTGRTEIWASSWPLILNKPIFGHGFYSSRFRTLIYSGESFSAIHLHNSFLETVYNNGLVGLGLLMMVLFVIVRNLWRTIHAGASKQVRYLAIGCMAAFVNLFINGMFNANFGGRPFAPYMIMIGLVVVSSHLWRIAQEEAVRQPAFSTSRQLLKETRQNAYTS
jgi:O-antigen ligase